MVFISPTWTQVGYIPLSDWDRMYAEARLKVTLSRRGIDSMFFGQSSIFAKYPSSKGKIVLAGSGVYPRC